MIKITADYWMASGRPDARCCCFLFCFYSRLGSRTHSAVTFSTHSENIRTVQMWGLLWWVHFKYVSILVNWQTQSWSESVSWPRAVKWDRVDWGATQTWRLLLLVSVPCVNCLLPLVLPILVWNILIKNLPFLRIDPGPMTKWHRPPPYPLPSPLRFLCNICSAIYAITHLCFLCITVAWFHCSGSAHSSRCRWGLSVTHLSVFISFHLLPWMTSHWKLLQLCMDSVAALWHCDCQLFPA